MPEACDRHELGAFDQLWRSPNWWPRGRPGHPALLWQGVSYAAEPNSHRSDRGWVPGFGM